jgi:hypothetical protein
MTCDAHDESESVDACCWHMVHAIHLATTVGCNGPTTYLKGQAPILKMGNEVPSFLSLYSIDPCRLPEGACSKLTLEKLILIINFEGANGYGEDISTLQEVNHVDLLV